MPEKHYRSVYPKLSSFYFVYFMLFGAFIPYIGLYYQSVGLNAIEIGELMAVFVGTKVVAPNLLGWLSDRTGQPIRWLRWCAFLTVLFSLGWLWFDQFWGLLLTVLGMSFFFHAALPLFESYTFVTLGELKSRYGLIRLWGSIGFIFAVIGVGWQLDQFSMATFPWVLLVLSLLIWVISYFVKEARIPTHADFSESFITILKQPHVASLLVVSVLVQFSHGTYYSFYSIFLTEHGYSHQSIAVLWTLGVLAEIGVFFWMRPLFHRYSVVGLLILSLGLTLLRWILIPLVPDYLPLLVFAQLLHAASYGLFHAAAIYLVDAYFQGKNQHRGQAIYASASHGLGGAFGMLSAGYAWHYGGAYWGFGVSALAVVIAILIAVKWVGKTPQSFQKSAI